MAMAEEAMETEGRQEWLYNAALEIKRSAVTEDEIKEVIRQLRELVPYKDSEALLQEAENTLKLEKDYQTALEAETQFKKDYKANDFDEDDLKELIRSLEALKEYRDAAKRAAKAQALLTGMYTARKKKTTVKIAVIAIVVLLFGGVTLYEMRTSGDEFSELIAQADNGDLNLQNRLGSMYYNGEGVRFDHKEAARWYLRAAEQGHSEAQYNLGTLYYQGQGVEKDIPRAVAWYRRSAEQGNAEAQNKMGGAYYNGWGVAKDYKQALKWYRRAARRGNAEAQTAVGNIYYNGTGVRRNYHEAVQWYEMAAGQGYAWAQYYLGNMYRNGLGVAKNLDKARKLYQQAVEQGHLGAMRALEHIRDL